MSRRPTPGSTGATPQLHPPAPPPGLLARLATALRSPDGFVALLGILTMGTKLCQGKLPMSDLKVYLKAGGQFLASEQLYDPSIFYRFKYPPTCAALFAPFSALPLPVAKCLVWGLLLACLILIFRQLERLAPTSDPWTPRLALLAGFGGMLHYDLHLGQLTLPLLLAMIWIARLLGEGRIALAGVLYALTLHVKPFGWPIAIWALWRGNRRFLAATAGAFALMTLLTVPFYGVEGSIAEWRGFAVEMQSLEAENLQVVRPENHSLGSALPRWLGAALWLPPKLATPLATTISLALLIGALLALPHRRAGSTPLAEFAAMLALIPLIGPSEYKYFLFTLPAAWLGIAAWRDLDGRGRTLLIVGLVGVGLNVYDLWGKHLARALAEGSVVAYGGAALFACSVLQLRSRHHTRPPVTAALRESRR